MLLKSPGEDDYTQPTDDVDPVYAVGIGPGGDGFLTNRAGFLLSEADLIVGFETVTARLDARSDSDVMVCGYDDQTTVLERFGRRVEDGASGVAVFWGDPNVSGAQFLERIESAIDRPVRIVPGISSIQVAAGRVRTPLEHSTIASLHRRGSVVEDLDRLADAGGSRHLLCLVRPYDWMPPTIATALIDRGVDPELEAYVCENLSLPTESISSTSLGELAAEAVTDPTPEQYSDLTILVVEAA